MTWKELSDWILAQPNNVQNQKAILVYDTFIHEIDVTKNNHEVGRITTAEFVILGNDDDLPPDAVVIAAGC